MVIIMTDLNKKTGTVSVAVTSLLTVIFSCATVLLLGGGIAYTVGAVLYGLGRTRRYMHAWFHLFVLLGSVLQFLCIIGYVI